MNSEALIELQENALSYCAAARGQLSLDELRSCFQINTFQWVILQTLETYDFIPFTEFQIDNQLQASLQGDAFSNHGHLRWAREWWVDENENRQNGWRAVYVGEEAHCPSFIKNTDAVKALKNPKTTAVLLRGERREQQDTWIDLRVPRRLDYPWPETSSVPEKVALEIRQFTIADNRILTQYAQLVSWQEGADS